MKNATVRRHARLNMVGRRRKHRALASPSPRGVQRFTRGAALSVVFFHSAGDV